jgi:SSS family solute:Na+ symporter
VAFTVGSPSNAYFANFGPTLRGRVVQTLDEEKGLAVIQIVQEDDSGQWIDVEGKMAPVKLFEGELSESARAADVVTGRSISVVYAAGNPDQIIPTYITSAMPKWFGLLFLLTLLAAAMSTLSSQFHAVGTSIGRDVYEQVTGKHGGSIGVNRAGIVIGIVIAMLWSYYSRGGYIVARATAIFFGLCASAFLPAFIGGLFWKRMNRKAAIASMVTGFAVTAFWLLFVKAKEAGAIGLVQKITGGKDSILAGHHNWPVVDPIVVALPISIIVAVAVALATRPPAKQQIEKCFK